MAEPPQILMEIREEPMVSPKGGNPTSQTSHFIKPVFQFSENPPKLPVILLPFHPIFPKCTFNGWANPTKPWVSWVNKLHSKYKIIWKKAGIYEAILSSRYNVVRNDEILLGLGERWCSETNTFVFSWGEAGITLEDVMVLGGFSVLGDPVSGFQKDGSVFDIEERLLDVYARLRGGLSGEVNKSVWMKRFLGRNTDIEHEAFLSFWLSMYVFPTYPFDSINPKCFSIAVCLSMGREIALAPAVLASVYKDLSLLKSAMGNVDRVNDFRDDLLMVTLWAPLHLVQVWVWERFPEFRPKPKEIEFGEPRIARWDGVNEVEIGNVRPLLQSAGGSFQWRPYCKDVDNLPSLDLYKDEEKLVCLDGNAGKHAQVMAHFLRVTELVGLESIEQYSPHRVAMQFGFDQDLPCSVKWVLSGTRKEREQVAWLNYAYVLNHQLLAIPSRTYEPKVTLRYLKWLREGVLKPEAALKGVVTRKRVSRRLRRFQPPRLLFADDEADSPPRPRARNMILSEIDVQRDFELNPTDNSLDVPSGFTPDFNVSSKLDEPCGFVSKKSVGNDLDAPPGFPPKSSIVTKKADVTPGLGSKKTVGNDLDAPPGFPPKSSVVTKKADVIPGFGSKKTVGHVIDVSTSFVPNPKGTDLDVPPGFLPKSIVAMNKADMPRELNLSKTVGGFVPTSIVNDPDVPPGFKPTPMKLDDVIKRKSVSETLVKVKKERVESIDNLPGYNLPNKKKKLTDVGGNSSGKSNQATCADDAGNEQSHRDVAPVMSRHGRGLSDANARVAQLEKILSALKEAK